MPDPINAALVLAAGSSFVTGCTFSGSTPHVVCTQAGRTDNTFVVEARSISNTILLQNWFIDKLGAASARPVASTEFPDGVAPANQPFVQRVTADLWMPRGSADTTRGPRGCVLDIGTPGGAAETTWSVQNLLSGTLFERVTLDPDERADWHVEQSTAPGSTARRRWWVNVDAVDEPEMVGPVIVAGLSRTAPAPVLEIVQRLVIPWNAADGVQAWARRSWLRGRRLVGAVWVKSDGPETVSVGFRETSAVQGIAPRYTLGIPNPLADEWRLVTGYVDPRSVEFPLQAIAAPDNTHVDHRLWGVDFVIRVTPQDNVKHKVVLGAPQVSWGPDLLPVGPPRIYTSGPEFGWHGRVGRITLSRGFLHEERIELHANSEEAEGLLGTQGMIESIHAGIDEGSGKCRFELSMIPLGQRSIPVATIAVDGARTSVKSNSVECPGISRLLLRRLDGDRRVAASVVVGLRHSRTI